MDTMVGTTIGGVIFVAGVVDDFFCTLRGTTGGAGGAAAAAADSGPLIGAGAGFGSESPREGLCGVFPLVGAKDLASNEVGGGEVPLGRSS